MVTESVDSPRPVAEVPPPPGGSSKKRPSTFKGAILGWFLTYPKCSEDPEVLKAHLIGPGEIPRVAELVVARELHKDGEPHLHAYVKFHPGHGVATKQANLRFDFVRTVMVEDGVAGRVSRWHGNYQPARSANAVIQYCTKDNDYITFGINIDAKRRKKSKEVTVDMFDRNVADLIDEGSVSFLQARSFSACQAVYQLARAPVVDAPNLRGLWLKGPAGCGKSRWVRGLYTDAAACYNKMQSKWWDGYQMQRIVHMEDVDHGAEGLGHHLKLWSDRYFVSGEIKGGTIPLKHEVFVVTSNYYPSDIWAQKEAMRDAIERRFIFIDLHTGQPTEDEMLQIWDRFPFLRPTVVSV